MTFTNFVWWVSQKSTAPLYYSFTSEYHHRPYRSFKKSTHVVVYQFRDEIKQIPTNVKIYITIFLHTIFNTFALEWIEMHTDAR